jgi:hypothetical protein
MKEIEIWAGERIDLACERLAREAPAFMMFNDTRVEAVPGDTAQAIYDRWSDRRVTTTPRTYSQREVDEMIALTIEACARTLEAVAPKYLGRQGPCCRYVARVLRGKDDQHLRDPYLRGLDERGKE